MSTVGEQIRAARKQKGLTQEQLAERIDRNLRTVQRIENSENAPRNETLSLICEVLEISLEEEPKKKIEDMVRKIAGLLLNIGFLVVLNLFTMLAFGMLTIAQGCCLNSQVAALGLGPLFAYFIVTITSKMSSIERFLKFGTGSIIYIFMNWERWGFPRSFVTLLIPSILLYLLILFYGNEILRFLNINTKD